MAEARSRSVRFSARGEETAVTVVDTDDLPLVDSAVAKLAQHRILGLDAHWNLEDGNYEPISALVLCGGSETFVFQLASSQLPMALALLLSHPGYAKVGINLLQDKAGRILRDFGATAAPEPFYDVVDLLKSELATEDVPTAVKQTFRDVSFKFDDVALLADWIKHPLPRKQVDNAAFLVWAARALWIYHGRPSGFPPACERAVPLDTERLLSRLTCEHCGLILEDTAALKRHINLQHYHPCACCGAVLHSLDALMDHRVKHHIVCPHCGMWVKDEGSLAQHDLDHHNNYCLAGCGAKFQTAAERTGHMLANHSQCGVCGQWFLTDAQLGVHVDMNHTSCPSCGEAFKTNKELQRHMYARVNGVCPKSPEKRTRPRSTDAAKGRTGPSQTTTPRNVAHPHTRPHTHTTGLSGSARRTGTGKGRQPSSLARPGYPVGTPGATPVRKAAKASSGPQPKRTARRDVAGLSSSGLSASPTSPERAYRSRFTSSSQSHRAPGHPVDGLETTTMVAVLTEGGANMSYDGVGDDFSYASLNNGPGTRTLRPHAEPGEHIWHPPPKHVPAPMSIADTADAVGMFG